MVKGHWFCVDFLSIPPPKKQLMSSGRAFLVTPPNHWVQAKSREIADGEELTVRKWYPLVIYSLLLKIAIYIVDFLLNMVIFHSYVNVYQRVNVLSQVMEKAVSG